ncbi:hypothetical protein JJV70_06460 [Streptomyces sp. JJ66]|uniref:anti-sigma factor family protein n=1 Tax=Streptomyces sp. JJ66 TaxID=2803843 RepID=UPI001C574816|nr:hypothetical protein [Streptomyces sp. JJ66]MBW1601760.1 hypothetical protein [Streptomyces sp. JJ66]
MTASFATSGPDGHPEVEEISALDEGLLTSDRAGQLRHHLDVCPLCADVLSALEEMRGTLGTLPDMPRMPDDVAERIDAALAAQALMGSAAQAGDPDVPHPGTATPEARPPADQPAHVSRETRRPAGAPAAKTGPGRGTPSTGRRSRGRQRRAARWGVTGVLAAAVAGALVIPVLLSADPERPPVVTEAEASRTAGLEERVHQLLTRAAAAEPTAPGHPEGQQKAQGEPEAHNAPDAPFTTETAPGATSVVPSCVQQATGRTETPIAAAEESYEGTASYLVLLPHHGDKGKVDAYVIDASCVDDAPDAPGERLASLTVERR